MSQNDKETVFIVGLGWMGKHLYKELSSEGYKVAGSVTTSEKAKKLRKDDIEAYQWRLPENDPPEAFKKSDLIIYTAPPSKGQEHSEKLIRSCIKAAKGSGIKKAIYISSTSVYPENNTTVTESDAEYIESRHTGVVMKKLEDQWENSDIHTTILRCGGLFGRDRSPALFLKDKLVRDADKPVNMTHIDDVVEAVEKIMADDAFDEVFNVVSINDTTREEFYKPYIKDMKVEKGIPKPYKVVSQDKLKDRFRITYSGPVGHDYPNKK